GRVLGGAGKLRKEIALLEVELAEIGDLLGVLQQVGAPGKERRHLGLGFYVALFPDKAEPGRVIELLPGADRQQDIVGLGILTSQVMRVIRSEHRDAKLLAQTEHAL